MERDTRDKVIEVKQDVKHLSDRFDGFEVKFDQMYEAFMQSKGGWKVALGFSSFVGFMGGVASWVLPWWFSRP